eukprot:tig00021339_g20423.t1
MGAGGEAHAPPPGPGPIVSDGVVLAASSASAACVASPLRHRNGYRSAAAAVAVRRGVTPWRDPRGAGALQRVCAFNPLKSLTCMRCVSLHGSDAGAGTAPGPGGACRRGRGGAPAPAPARGGALGGPALQPAGSSSAAAVPGSARRPPSKIWGSGRKRAARALGRSGRRGGRRARPAAASVGRRLWPPLAHRLQPSASAPQAPARPTRPCAPSPAAAPPGRCPVRMPVLVGSSRPARARPAS